MGAQESTSSHCSVNYVDTMNFLLKIKTWTKAVLGIGTTSPPFSICKLFDLESTIGTKGRIGGGGHFPMGYIPIVSKAGIKGSGC